MIDGWLRLSSLQWGPKRREELRNWGERFAKVQKFQEDLQRAIDKKKTSFLIRVDRVKDDDSSDQLQSLYHQ